MEKKISKSIDQTWLDVFRDIFKVAYDKLYDCLKKQNAWQFFKACQIFNPYFAKNQSSTAWNTYANGLPGQNI